VASLPAAAIRCLSPLALTQGGTKKGEPGPRRPFAKHRLCFLLLFLISPGLRNYRQQAGLTVPAPPGRLPQAAGAELSPCSTAASPAPTDASPQLIYLRSGCFHRLWWCLITVNDRGAPYFCLEAGKSLGTGKQAPHVLPDAIGAAAAFMWCASRRPKSRDASEEAISLNCCGHRHFLSTLVT